MTAYLNLLKQIFKQDNNLDQETKKLIYEISFLLISIFIEILLGLVINCSFIYYFL
jgi:hypothetical protein